MFREFYDELEAGREPQATFHYTQPAPPQIIPQKTTEPLKNQRGTSYESSYSDSDSGYDSQDEPSHKGSPFRFYQNIFEKVERKKNTKFRAFVESPAITKLSSNGYPRAVKMSFFARFDNKAKQFLIFIGDESSSTKNNSSPDFRLQMKDSSPTPPQSAQQKSNQTAVAKQVSWVLWSESCEGCIGQKRCIPTTEKRQWLMTIIHTVDKDSESQAVHKLALFIPTSEDNLKTLVVCPRTMSESNNANLFNINARDFSFFDLTPKPNSPLVLPDECFYLRTKNPQWSESMKAFVLDSYGRIKLPSKRNFQLLFDVMNFSDECDSSNRDQAEILDSDYFPVFQLGKTATGTYVLDYRHPLSFVQAFAIALTTSTWKSKL